MERFLWMVVLTAAILMISQASSQGICDPLVPENCLLPFPNNFWAKAVRRCQMPFLFFLFFLFSFSFSIFSEKKRREKGLK